MRYLWYSMYGFVASLAIYSLFFRPQVADDRTPSPHEVNSVTNQVQIALILDTSASMDGLVNQARAQIWEMVAEMQSNQNGQEQEVALALYQYGNNRLSKDSGYIEKLSTLTKDIDQVSVQLYSLTTSGGKEYAPQAVLRAVQELDWNQDAGVRKMIVLAGNENFQQGQVSTQAAIKSATEAGIEIIPIFCHNRGASNSATQSWKIAAELAGTDLEKINSDNRVAEAVSPYDQDIMNKYEELEKLRPSSSPYQAQVKGLVTGGAAVDRALVQSRSQRARPTKNPTSARRAVELERELQSLSVKRRAYKNQKLRGKSATPSTSLGRAFRRQTNSPISY